MSNDPKIIEDEERLMALLALTSQQLPYPPHEFTDKDWENIDFDSLSTEQQEAYFLYLDTHPELFEKISQRARSHEISPVPTKLKEIAFVRNSVSQLKRQIQNTLSIPVIRYGFAGTLVIAITLILAWPTQNDTDIGTRIDHSFVELDHQSLLPNEPLTLPWEQASAGLGFSPTQNPHPRLAEAFAVGLQLGVGYLNQASTNSSLDTLIDSQTKSVDALPEEISLYRELGRWNILLWVTSQHVDNLEPAFWQQQLDLSRQFQSRLLTLGDTQTVVSAHLTNTATLLEQLHQQTSIRRNATQLREEVTSFRNLFSPAQNPGQ